MNTTRRGFFGFFAGAATLATVPFPHRPVLTINQMEHFRRMVQHEENHRLLYNYWRNTSTERIALEPKARWLVKPEDIKNVVHVQFRSTA